MAHRNRWFTYWRWWFSMAMLNNQMVIVLISWWLYGLNDGFGISHMLHGAGMSTFTPSTMAQHPFPSLETRLWWRSAPKNGSAAQKSRGRLLIVATSRREVHGFQQKSWKSYYKMWWNQDGTNRWFVSPHEAVSQFPGTGQFLRGGAVSLSVHPSGQHVEGRRHHRESSVKECRRTPTAGAGFDSWAAYGESQSGGQEPHTLCIQPCAPPDQRSHCGRDAQ